MNDNPSKALRWCIAVVLASSIHVRADAGGVDAEADAQAPMRVDGRLILSADDVAELPRERLIGMLGADLPWSRKAASEVLAREGVSSIPVFATALADPDWRVVRAGLDGLLKLLDDKDEAQEADGKGVRTAVAAMVSDTGELLRHQHHHVRKGALEVLSKLGEDAASVAADVCGMFTDEDFLGVAPQAFKTISAIGFEHVEDDVLMAALRKAVCSPDLSVRAAAFSIVKRLLEEEKQRELIPAMIEALQTPMKDGYTRYALQGGIANLLYDLGEKQVLPLSIAILAEKGWGHSHRVDIFVPILAKFGPEAVSALPLLEPQLERFKEDARKCAMIQSAIARIKGEDK